MAPLGATGYDCAVTSEEIPERQKRFYTLVYATTTWDDFRDITANFEADGWRLDASAITIDRGDGEKFEDPGDRSGEPAPLLFSTRALGGGVLSQWKTWVWALAYGCGVAVFLLVLVTRRRVLARSRATFCAGC